MKIFGAAKAASLVACLGLGACATVISGTTQNIAVATTPSGAQCDLKRDGVLLGTIAQTPGAVRVDKSRANINLKCTKPGYRNGEALAKSSLNHWIWGNVILGGVVGVIIDGSSGAANHYPEQVSLALTADQAQRYGQRQPPAYNAPYGQPQRPYGQPQRPYAPRQPAYGQPQPSASDNMDILIIDAGD